VLWFMIQLMKAKGSLFPRTNLTADPIVLDTYDVLHGWKLLDFTWKQIQGGKKTKTKPHACFDSGQSESHDAARQHGRSATDVHQHAGGAHHTLREGDVIGVWNSILHNWKR
jgi:hypothetical protein